MSCPICDGEVTVLGIKHLDIKDAKIQMCDKCDYVYVNCDNYTIEDIYNHQNNHVENFGHNLQRNSSYLDYLINLSKTKTIKRLLEIGTPKNHDFLSKVNSTFGNSIKIYSYDIIENNLPNYINFFSDKNKIIEEDIDILFCIHTLEHIPSNQIVDFVNFCKKVSKYFIFEVPFCKTNERIIKSSTNPHYSFFTEKSIMKLFGDVNIEIDNNRLKFNNLN